MNFYSLHFNFLIPFKVEIIIQKLTISISHFYFLFISSVLLTENPNGTTNKSKIYSVWSVDQIRTHPIWNRTQHFIFLLSFLLNCLFSESNSKRKLFFLLLENSYLCIIILAFHMNSWIHFNSEIFYYVFLFLIYNFSYGFFF